jgi:hypothetical protein
MRGEVTTETSAIIQLRGARHPGRIASCVADGVDDDFRLSDLVENEKRIR